MISSDRFERQLPERLADLASARVPDYFNDLLGATGRTRQRPPWASLERWFPMDLTMPTRLGQARSAPRLALLLLLVLLVLAAVLAYSGSREAHLPAPFGPAANGSMYFNAANGNVVAADSVTMVAKDVFSPPADATGDGVLPSRGGLKIAVLEKVSGGEQVVVADQDGKNGHQLAGIYANLSEVDWSPDDKQVAVVSEVSGAATISILPVDGSAAATLSLGLETHSFWYRPDGSFAFTGTKTGAGGTTYGLYTVKADGTALRLILPTTSAELDWLSMNASQDGRSLVYHRWRDPGEKGRLHLVDIATGTDTTVQVAGVTASDEFEGATFSPDSQSLLFHWFTDGGIVRLAEVPVGGGTAVQFGPAVPIDVAPNAGFSPDGKSVVAWYPSLHQLWLLDPTGNTAADRKLALSVSDVPTWQRLAP